MKTANDLPNTGDLISGGWRAGYAKGQNIDPKAHAQTEKLARSGCGKIWVDPFTIKKNNDPAPAQSNLCACIKSLAPGDTLIVANLNALAPNQVSLTEILCELQEKGIELESLDERVDTRHDRSLFNAALLYAKFQKGHLSERNTAGLNKDRARGRKGGRNPKLTATQKEQILLLMADSHTKPLAVCQQYNIGKSLLYRVVREGRVVQESKDPKCEDNE
jgi:DNA invertase Pin-like site-specific DNA recombinase